MYTQYCVYKNMYNYVCNQDKRLSPWALYKKLVHVYKGNQMYYLCKCVSRPFSYAFLWSEVSPDADMLIQFVELLWARGSVAHIPDFKMAAPINVLAFTRKVYHRETNASI